MTDPESSVPAPRDSGAEREHAADQRLAVVSILSGINVRRGAKVTRHDRKGLKRAKG